MQENSFSKEDYNNFFVKDRGKRQTALKIALDVRKFEIDLYWKRATYFWTFIAAALAGYGVIQASSIANKSDLSVFLSCLGIVFSVGWLCANRGSKYWQENWENHVGLLEDKECGPVFKVVLERPRPKGFSNNVEYLLNGPSSISVSKVNQIISIYVIFLWGLLLFYSLPEFNRKAPINWYYVVVIFLTFCTCISFFFKFGRTHKGNKKHIATIRKTQIEDES